MDWDNEQICHWLTAVGLGEYVQVFRGMFVKLGITGKESVVWLFLLVRERGGGPRFKFNFYFLGTPKIIKILVVPQIIDGVPPTGIFFLEKPLVKLPLPLKQYSITVPDCPRSYILWSKK